VESVVLDVRTRQLVEADRSASALERAGHHLELFPDFIVSRLLHEVIILECCNKRAVLRTLPMLMHISGNLIA